MYNLKLIIGQENQHRFLGAKFKAERLAKRYSLEFLATHAEIATSEQLGKFEQGVAGLPLNRIYALANVLGLSPKNVLEWLAAED